MSVPLTVHGESLGALNLYAESKAAFTDAHEDTVQIFADQAAIALANAQVYWDARQLSENLTQAIKSRETIDHAVGILMATGGISPQDAFQILVRASQRGESQTQRRRRGNRDSDHRAEDGGITG